LKRIRQMEALMIRTVSLWIRIDGKYVHPTYANSKQTQLKPQDGEYYLLGGQQSILPQLAQLFATRTQCAEDNSLHKWAETEKARVQQFSYS